MALGWIKSAALAGVMLAGVALPAGAVTVSSISANQLTVDVDIPGATLIGGTVIGAFIDFYNFTLVSASSVSATASATNSNGAIVPFTISAWNGSDGTGSQIGSTFSGNTNIALGTTILAPGVYSIEITGTGPGGSGATFGGSLNLSPVPLPGALVLFGSGLVGLVALGRKRKQNAQAALV